MAILGFIGQQIAAYGFNKGLDKLFSSKEDFTTRLNKVIYQTIEEFEKNNLTPDANGKYAFYKSNELVTEFLKYRIFAKKGHDLSSKVIQNALEINPNIIKPSIHDIEEFIAIFDRLVSQDEKLKQLEFEAFPYEVILNIYNNVEKSLNFLKTHLIEVIPLLEEEYREELNTYVDELESLKPKSALTHIDGLQKRVNKNLKHVSNKIQASLNYFKGVCYEALRSSNEAFECFINANKIVPENIQYLGKACIAYYQLKDEKYIELKQQIDQKELFNEVSWAISTIESEDPISFIEESINPIVLNKDYYKRLVFNNLLKTNSLHIPDLIRVLSVSSLSKELPKEINYDNFHHWIFVMNALSIQFFNNRSIDYLGFIEKDDRSLKILNLAKVLSKAIIDSELDDSYYAVVFTYYWFQSEIDPQPDTLRNLKDSYQKIGGDDTFKTLLYANSIRKYEGDRAAIEIINKYDGVLDENLLSLKTFCILENPQPDDLILEYFQFIDRIDELNIQNICGFLIPIGKFGLITKADLIKSFEIIEYSKPEYRVLILSLINTLLNREEVIHVEGINSLRNSLNQERNLYFYVALLYYENGYIEECIQFQETYVDENEESGNLRLYIQALNTRGKTSQIKLLSLLKKWRTSFSFDDYLLRIEIELRQILKDWQELLFIAEYGLNNKPDDEVFFTLYLIALFNTDKTEQILGDLEKIETFNFQITENVLKVAYILFQLDKPDIGIELIHKKAVNKSDSLARVNFFYLSTNLPQEYFTDLQTVEDNCYVKFEIDGEVETKYIDSKNDSTQIVQKSIGKNQSETFAIENPITRSVKNVRILRIMNKYLALLDEIYAEANSSFSNLPLGTLQFESTDIEGLEKAFIESFGATHEESRKKRDANFDKYYQYQLSFTELVSLNFEGSVIDTYYHLISNQSDGFLIKPLKYFGVGISPDKRSLVLDFCSGLLLFELAEKLGLKYDKFIISENLLFLIDEEISKTESMRNSKMSITLINNKIFPQFYPDDFHDKRIDFLRNLKRWFSDCSISEIPEEKIEVARPLYKEGKINKHFDYVIDNTFLAQRKDHLLITDDIIYQSKLRIQNWSTTENYLLNKFPEKKNAILKALLQFRYVGISVNSELLYQAYIDQHNTGSSHTYNYTLRNLSLPLNFSPFNILTSVDFLKKLALNPAISHEKFKIDASNVLFMLISSFPNPGYNFTLKSRIEQQFNLLGEYFNLIFEALETALKISLSSK